MARSTETESAKSLNVLKEENSEEKDFSEIEEHFDDTQAAELPSMVKQQALFGDIVPFNWMQKRKNSRGLQQQEVRTAVYLCLRTSTIV